MTLRRPLPALSDLLGLHVLTMGSSNPASCLNSSRRCDQVRSTGRIHRTAIDGNGDAGHRSSSHSERITSTRRTIGPPSRTRRHTTYTGTSAWSGTRSSQRRQSLWTAAGCGSCRTPSASPPPRGRTTGLSPSPGVRLLAPVGVIAAAVDVPTAGDGLVQSPQSLHVAIRPTPTSTPMVGPDFTAGSPRERLDAATGEPRPRRPVDRNFADGSGEPRMLHHGDLADLRQDHNLVVHAHGVRSIVGAKALLMPPALEPRESGMATGTLASPHALAMSSPGVRRLTQVDDRAGNLGAGGGSAREKMRRPGRASTPAGAPPESLII